MLTIIIVSGMSGELILFARLTSCLIVEFNAHL